MAGRYARTFDRVDDMIAMSLDAFPADEPMAFAAIFRKAADTDGFIIGTDVDGLNTYGRGLRSGLNSGNTAMFYDASAGGLGLTGAAAPITLNRWYLAVVSRTAASPGSVVASLCDYVTQTWTHSAAQNLAREAANTGGHIVIGTGRSAGGIYHGGEIAVCGVVGIVPTQAQKEGMVSGGLSTLDMWAASGWTAANNAKVFPLDQASVATPVSDAVGGSTQVSITGTTVYDALDTVPWQTTIQVAEPAGTTGMFDFDLSIHPLGWF